MKVEAVTEGGEGGTAGSNSSTWQEAAAEMRAWLLSQGQLPALQGGSLTI